MTVDAQAIFDRYVHDVARQLPASKRDDVAFELRGLLTEELQGKAASAGRTPDPEMAMEIAAAFGRPAEVAARYHPPYTIIDPVDTRGYVIAAVAGLTVLGVVVTPALRERGGASQLGDVLSLSWLGFLVLAFALKSWAFRRWPDLGVWKPRPVVVPDRASRTGNMVIAALAVVALAIYMVPVAILALVPGVGDPAAFAYTDDFRSVLRMPWLIGILAAYAVLHLFVGVTGRWRRSTRWIDAALTLHIGLQLGWHLSYGNVFVSADMEASIGPGLRVVAAVMILLAAFLAYREWSRVRPGPSLSAASRLVEAGPSR